MIDYLWVGLVFLDMKKLPNKDLISFSPGFVNGIATDTGGFTHFYLALNRTLPICYFNHTYNRTAYANLEKLTCKECRASGTSFCEHAIEKTKTWGHFDDSQIRYIIASGPNDVEFFLNSNFLHYRGGTNWDGQPSEYHAKKSKIFLDYINSILLPLQKGCQNGGQNID